MKTDWAVHDTVVIDRVYPAPRAHVFDAWADVEQRKLWHFPGDADWVVLEMAQDFVVGGEERMRFGPRSAPNLHSTGRFLDIVDNARIVSAGTMHRDGVPISVTLCTVELADSASGGTRVKLTDQSAYFDGNEAPQDRQSGWGKVLQRLQAHLNTVAPPNDRKGGNA